MAGMFGLFDYTKSGAGVSKNEPEKRGFFLFFELYFRKFGKLISINLLYFICCIPFILPYLALSILWGKHFLTSNLANNLFIMISLVPVIGIAPLTAGFTFIMRNFARGEHAFIWMDFRDTIKSNWKQSLAIGTIQFVVICLLSISIGFYNNLLHSNVIFALPLILCLFILLVFLFMQYYIFTLMITFELDTKSLLKNSVIFSFVGAGWNILITVLLILHAILIYIFFPFTLILIPLIALSTAGFTINFITWPIIKKYLIPKESKSGSDNNKSIFEDTGKQK